MARTGELAFDVERIRGAIGVSNYGTYHIVEKDLFSKVEGGDELYRMLYEMFKVRDE